MIKRFIFTVLIIFMFAGASFGADENSNEYLRKDVFEARMDALEARMNALIAEMRLANEQLRTELRNEMQNTRTELQKEIQDTRNELRNEVREMNDNLSKRIDANSTAIAINSSRIDSLTHAIYWLWGAFAALLAVLTLLLTKHYELTTERIEKVSQEVAEKVARQIIEQVLDARLSSK